MTFFKNTFISQRPVVASFADMIKIVTTLIKTKLKELEIMYQNTVYICISWYSKICWSPVKKCWCQQNLRGVSLDSYIFCIFFCAKFHHCNICATEFRDREHHQESPSWIGLKKKSRLTLNNRQKLLVFSNLNFLKWIC